MIDSFNRMPDSSRIWIYQGDRQLAPDEKILVETRVRIFLDKWQAHGSDLFASFQLFYNQVLVIAVDERHQQATGCSIDAKVATIKELSNLLELDFFNRLNIGLVDQSDQLITSPLSKVKKALKAGEINAEQTRLLDNTVTSLGAFRSGWKKPIGESWLAPFAKSALK